MAIWSASAMNAAMLLALLVLHGSVAFQGLLSIHRSLLGSRYGTTQAAASGTAINRLAGQTSLTSSEGPAHSTGLAYAASTVPVLKDILRSRGLPVSGIKAALLSRLEADDATRVIRSTTAATESGNEDSIIDSLDSLDDFYDSLEMQHQASANGGRPYTRGDGVDDSETKGVSEDADADVPKVYPNRPDWCTRGDRISVTVNRYGPLGASVDIRMCDDAEDVAFRGQGLILHDEVISKISISNPSEGGEGVAASLSVLLYCCIVVLLYGCVVVVVVCVRIRIHAIAPLTNPHRRIPCAPR
jgi:hypothetical protein